MLASLCVCGVRDGGLSCLQVAISSHELLPCACVVVRMQVRDCGLTCLLVAVPSSRVAATEFDWTFRGCLCLCCCVNAG